MKAKTLAIMCEQAEQAEERRSELISAHDGWSPLDGVPAPEWVPEAWCGPHVGLRLVEAFKTLLRLPAVATFRVSLTYWPTYLVEWEDQLAQQQMTDADKEEQIFWANRSRLKPSARDVSRMEAAISWPARYLQSRPLVMRRTQQVAFERARARGETDIDRIAHRLKVSAHRLQQVNRAGLDAIAAGLRRDRVMVF